MEWKQLSQDNQENKFNFYGSLGLASIVEDKRKMNKVLRLASFSPDFFYEKKKDSKGRIYFDRYKYLGSGFGINVHGYRRTRINKEGKQVEKHIVMDWGVFAFGSQNLRVENCFIDSCKEQKIFCFTEDKGSKNTLEFRINNVLELLDEYKDMKNEVEVEDFEAGVTSINAAMLMPFGTVILPIEKTAKHDLERMVEEHMQKELLTHARTGDVNAELILAQMAKEKQEEISKRIAQEDLLSIFEGYFLGIKDRTGIFDILADIISVEELTNEATMEKIYRICVTATDTKLTVYINKNDLTGIPTPGMRLMGTGILQGVIDFKARN